MSANRRTRDERHTGVVIGELHRHEVDGPEQAPPEPPVPPAGGPRVTFADGESRRWNDLELSPDDVEPPEPVKTDPDLDPDDGPGHDPDTGDEPDGPYRRDPVDEPAVDEPETYDPEPYAPEPNEPDHPPEEPETPKTQETPDETPRAEDAPPESEEPDAPEQAPEPVDAPAEVAPVADEARPGAPTLPGLPGAHGVRDAGPDLGPRPLPETPPAPEVPVPGVPALPPEPELAVRPAPEPWRPAAETLPENPPEPVRDDPEPRTPPDRLAEPRDTAPDDRVARRVREAAEAREQDEERDPDTRADTGGGARGDASVIPATGTDAREGADPDRPCVPEPPAYVNYGRDGIARKDAYIDAAKRDDEALRVGVPDAAYETGLVRAYADRLRDDVGPAVREEVGALAEEFGGTAAVDVSGPDAIAERVRAAERPGYQVGDVTDAVRARVEVADPAALPGLLAAAERRFGTGDRGRILEVRPTATEIPVTVATTHEGRRYAYELRLGVR